MADAHDRLAGLASVYGVKGDTPDAVMAGISNKLEAMSDAERQTHNLNYTELASIESELQQTGGKGFPGDGVDYSGLEKLMGVSKPAEDTTTGGRQTASRMSREEMVDTVWAEFGAVYDYRPSETGNIEAIAQQVWQERGYSNADMNDPALRRQYVAQVGAKAGTKAKGGGKAADDNEPDGRTAGVGGGGYGSGGGGSKGSGRLPTSEEDNANWIKDMGELRQKLGSL